MGLLRSPDGRWIIGPERVQINRTDGLICPKSAMAEPFLKAFDTSTVRVLPQTVLR